MLKKQKIKIKSPLCILCGGIIVRLSTIKYIKLKTQKKLMVVLKTPT